MAKPSSSPDPVAIFRFLRSGTGLHQFLTTVCTLISPSVNASPSDRTVLTGMRA